MKLASSLSTYKKKDSALREYIYARCPNCDAEMIVAKEGIFEAVKAVPWWVWGILLALIAYVHYQFFLEFIIDPAYKTLILLAVLWTICLIILVVGPTVRAIIDGLRK